MPTQGARIKKIRTALSLSQEAFGGLLGVSKQYISNLEANRNVLNNEKLVMLSVDYDVNLNYLFNGFGEIFLNNCENTHAFVKNGNVLSHYKNWGKRLGQILTEAEETPYNFSKITGIKESRIEKFILDSVEPTLSELNAIKSNVDVSIDWLLYAETVAAQEPQANVSLSANEILKIKQLLNRSEI